MPFAEHDQVIHTFSAHGADDAFAVGILPGRTWRDRDFFNAHAFDCASPAIFVVFVFGPSGPESRRKRSLTWSSASVVDLFSAMKDDFDGSARTAAHRVPVVRCSFMSRPLDREPLWTKTLHAALSLCSAQIARKNVVSAFVLPATSGQ